MLIKICGLKTIDDALAASNAGADMLGFVFVPRSPRAISADAADEIVFEVKEDAERAGRPAPAFVGLFVDAGEKLIAEAAPFLTHLQFHGHEDAERIAELRAEFGAPVIKAIGVGEAADLGGCAAFAEAADYLLFDARPPKGADRPGGHGAPFDWSHLSLYREATPFLLAGGLDAANVAAAIAAARGNGAFAGVDVSSGVELRPGVKDPDRIEAFIAAARRGA
jgi:phosphoribosylanthranilate isomerase